MQTSGNLKTNLRITLAITGKDILDAIKNKTTLSVLATSFFLLLFYIFFPILEEEDIIRLYDAGMSTWLPSLEASIPNRIIVESSQDSMEYNIARSYSPLKGNCPVSISYKTTPSDQISDR